MSDRIKRTSFADTLRNAQLALWQKHKDEGMLPTAGRFMYYELISMGVLDKTNKNHVIYHNKYLKQLRDEGRIPWDDITDESRRVEDYTGHSSLNDAVRRYVPCVRLDRWQGDWPMVITESRSVAGAIRDVCYNFQTQLTPLNGQCGGFLHTHVIPKIRPGQHVLYLGDLDKSGLDIENNTRAVIERSVGRVRWERVAVTEEQKEEYGLTPIPKYDERTKKSHDAIETEALGQSEIVKIVTARLSELLPDDGGEFLETEQREREEIMARLDPAA